MTQPAALDAEMSIIGALLIDPAALDRIDLLPTDFYDGACREAYELIRKMLQTGHSVDIVTVSEAMLPQGLIARSGGLGWLGELAAAVPGSRAIQTYARQVHERAIERAAMAAAHDILIAVGDRSKSIEEKVDYFEARILEVTDRGVQQKEPTPISELLCEHTDALSQRVDGTAVCISTYYDDLDEKTLGGLRPGELIIVAGRPSMGKSAFSFGMGEEIAVRGGKSVLFLSMEMSSLMVVDRLLASFARIPLPRIMTGKLLEEDFSRLAAAYAQLAQSKIFVDDQAALSLLDVRSKARTVKRKHGLDLIVLDYLQLMSSPNSKGGNRNAEIEEISRGLKQLAKELGIPVVALSQLNRQLEQRPNKRPMMSDLRDSGAVEQDADTIIFLYRDEVYNPDTQDKGMAEAIIGKQRNGALSTVRLAFQGEYTRFENLGYGASAF